MKTECPKPTLSIVVPIFNAEEYLAESLDSIYAQKIDAFEVLCINDGSTDGSLAIIQKYASRDARFKVIDVPNGGYGKAMNLGLGAAQGEYVAILEPDDLVAPGSYRKLLDLAESNQLDFVKGSLCMFTVGEGKKLNMQHKQVYPTVNVVIRPRDYGDIFVNLMPSTVSAVYNLDFIRRNNIRYHESPGASYQDTGFYFMTSLWAERAMFVNVDVYMYRKGNPNASTSIQSRALKMFLLGKEYKYIKSRLEEKPSIWEEVKPLFLAKRIDGHLWVYYSLPYSSKLEYLEATREEFIEYENYGTDFMKHRVHFLNELLLSPQYFLFSDLMRSRATMQLQSADLRSDICAVASYQRDFLKQLWYSIALCFLVGKARERTKERIANCKRRIKRAKSVLKNI